MNQNKASFLWLRRNLRACGSIFRIRMAEGLQYRTQMLSGVVVGVFWVLIEITVYLAFSRYGLWSDQTGGGLSIQQIVTYAWLGQCLMVLQLGGVDGELVKKINSGDVGIELCRPLDFYGNWFAQTAAGRVAPLLLRGLPVLAVGLLMPMTYRMRAPASLPGFLAFFCASGMAFLLAASFAMLGTILQMNVSWGNGPVGMVFLVGEFLSGLRLPLRLWPEFMQPFLRIQPFAGLVDLPVQLYVGSIPPEEVWGVLGIQLLWTAVFIFAGRLLANRRLKHVIVQGG